MQRKLPIRFYGSSSTLLGGEAYTSLQFISNEEEAGVIMYTCDCHLKEVCGWVLVQSALIRIRIESKV